MITASRDVDKTGGIRYEEEHNILSSWMVE